MDSLFGRKFLWLSGTLTVAGSALLAFVFVQRASASREYANQVRLAVESIDSLRQSAIVYSDLSIQPGVTFSGALERMEVAPEQAQQVIAAAGTVFDLRQLRAGNEVNLGRTITGKLQEVRYQIDDERMLSVHASDDGFAAEVQTIPYRTETVSVSGEISNSLFAAISDAGEGPELAMRLAAIFGWDLDFYTDPRVGDTFRVQVERKVSLDGKSRTYGRVNYAEYVNDGHPYRALLFRDSEGKPAYFSPDGRSLQKAFLRSPLKFSAAVTSGFSRGRFHPILHETRAHLGTDYGAPTGTPVQTIGSGRVTFAGYKGGNGNMVQVHHSNGYDTLYLHLSRIFVHTGDRVDTGDRIGLVGMTGLATGPHLHFSVLDHGVYRNFETLRRNLPSAEPVPQREMTEFTSLRDSIMGQMNGPSLVTRANDQNVAAKPPLRPASLR